MISGMLHWRCIVCGAIYFVPKHGDRCEDRVACKKRIVAFTSDPVTRTQLSPLNNAYMGENDAEESKEGSTTGRKVGGNSY